VIVNLDNGCYYSLRHTGAEIWGHIENGKGTAEIVASLSGRYSANVDVLHSAVQRLIGELQAEGIVSPQTDAAASANGQAGPPSPPNLASALGVFELPILEKYSDMQQMLLLDPIHDVDETGWPNKK